jgi:hypothetical protein
MDLNNMVEEAARMQAVSGEEFLRWAAGLGIGVDPRYPDSRSLRLLPPTDHDRFWVVPPDPATWPHFVASLLGGLDDWETGVLWPKFGSWPLFGLSQSYHEGVRAVVLRGVGIPDGWSGAARFERDEEGALVAVLFAFMVFGSCVYDDLLFVPDHGRQLLHTDHHYVIHAGCKCESRVLELVAHMAAEGYELPTELPDETFRRPAWMGGGEGEPGDERVGM